MNLTEVVAKVTGLEEKMTASDSRIKTLETDLSAQQTENGNLSSKIVTLTSELAAANTSKTELETKVTEATTQMTELQTKNQELQTTIDNPKGTIQTEAAKASQRIIASTGTPPIEETKPGENTNGGESVVDQYSSIEDPTKRFEYFQKNYKASLNRAMAGALT